MQRKRDVRRPDSVKQLEGLVEGSVARIHILLPISQRSNWQTTGGAYDTP